MAAGHPYDAIMEDYCAEELELHYEAALRHRARTTKHWARVLRVAPNADKKTWKAYMRELDNTWKRVELAAGRSTINVEGFAGMKPHGTKGR